MKRAHLKQFENKYPCDECSFAATSNQWLKDHKKSIHSKVKDFKCVECEKPFALRAYLLKHVKKMHSDSESVEIDMKIEKIARHASSPLEFLEEAYEEGLFEAI